MRLAIAPVRLQSLTDGHVAEVTAGELAHVLSERLRVPCASIPPSTALRGTRYAVTSLPVGGDAFVSGPRGLDHYRRIA